MTSDLTDLPDPKARREREENLEVPGRRGIEATRVYEDLWELLDFPVILVYSVYLVRTDWTDATGLMAVPVPQVYREFSGHVVV